MRLSKSERKRLRRQYETQVRERIFPAVVVSDFATMEAVPPRRLVDEAASLRVNLRAIQSTELNWIVRPPSAPAEVFCELSYGAVTEDLLADFAQLEDLRELKEQISPDSPCISVVAKANLHPANDFLLLTLLRCLGRTAKGTLADYSRGFLMDDWLSWSLDYMERDMFKVNRVYDENAQDPMSLLAEIPSLRKRRFWPFGRR